MRNLILIAHNLRSCHNVGALLRTADGLGIEHVYLTGYTPYPEEISDSRLPHLSAKIARQIHKTALGAEHTIPWTHQTDVTRVITELEKGGYSVAAIEQDKRAILLPEYKPPSKLALLVGREVEGVEEEVLALCDSILEIPMFGQKESFNVALATAMGLYHCRFA